MSPVHLAFVAMIALIFLGPKKLPELARSIGSGIREFRESMSVGEARDAIAEIKQVAGAPLAAAPAAETPLAATTTAATPAAAPTAPAPTAAPAPAPGPPASPVAPDPAAPSPSPEQPH